MSRYRDLQRAAGLDVEDEHMEADPCRWVAGVECELEDTVYEGMQCLMVPMSGL